MALGKVFNLMGVCGLGRGVDWVREFPVGASTHSFDIGRVMMGRFVVMVRVCWEAPAWPCWGFAGGVWWVVVRVAVLEMRVIFMSFFGEACSQTMAVKFQRGG